MNKEPAQPKLDFAPFKRVGFKKVGGSQKKPEKKNKRRVQQARKTGVVLCKTVDPSVAAKADSGLKLHVVLFGLLKQQLGHEELESLILRVLNWGKSYCHINNISRDPLTVRKTTPESLMEILVNSGWVAAHGEPAADAIKESCMLVDGCRLGLPLTGKIRKPVAAIVNFVTEVMNPPKHSKMYFAVTEERMDSNYVDAEELDKTYSASDRTYAARLLSGFARSNRWAADDASERDLDAGDTPHTMLETHPANELSPSVTFLMVDYYRSHPVTEAVAYRLLHNLLGPLLRHCRRSLVIHAAHMARPDHPMWGGIHHLGRKARVILEANPAFSPPVPHSVIFDCGEIPFIPGGPRPPDGAAPKVFIARPENSSEEDVRAIAAAYPNHLIWANKPRPFGSLTRGKPGDRSRSLARIEDATLIFAPVSYLAWIYVRRAVISEDDKFLLPDFSLAAEFQVTEESSLEGRNRAAARDIASLDKIIAKATAEKACMLKRE